MIKIVLYTKTDILVRFTVSGHSGYAQSGSDIVCSAVSTLVINTINYITEFIDKNVAVNLDDEIGLIDCTILSAKNGIVDDRTTLLLDAMVFGLMSLQKDYRKFIKVSEEALND